MKILLIEDYAVVGVFHFTGKILLVTNTSKAEDREAQNFIWEGKDKFNMPTSYKE